MSALFDFNAFLTVVLLTICTCTYVKLSAPSVLNQKKGYFPLTSEVPVQVLEIASDSQYSAAFESPYFQVECASYCS